MAVTARRRNYKGRMADALQDMRGLLPISFNVSTNVQLYLNDETMHTRVTLPNFVSLFAPATRATCRYRLWAFDGAGGALGERQIDLAPFGAADIDLGTLFDGALPAFGMFAAHMTLRPKFSYAAHHLGRLMPQFLTLYEARGMLAPQASMALIHCLSKLGQRPVPHAAWRSTLPIDTDGVAALEVYQVNPSPQAVRSELYLEAPDGGRIVADKASVPPLATRRVRWPREAFAGRRWLRLGAHGLTAPNAKPLLFVHFADGSFSAQHP